MHLTYILYAINSSSQNGFHWMTSAFLSWLFQFSTFIILMLQQLANNWWRGRAAIPCRVNELQMWMTFSILWLFWGFWEIMNSEIALFWCQLAWRTARLPKDHFSSPILNILRVDPGLWAREAHLCMTYCLWFLWYTKLARKEYFFCFHSLKKIKVEIKDVCFSVEYQFLMFQRQTCRQLITISLIELWFVKSIDYLVFWKYHHLQLSSFSRRGKSQS